MRIFHTILIGLSASLFTACSGAQLAMNIGLDGPVSCDPQDFQKVQRVLSDVYEMEVGWPKNKVHAYAGRPTRTGVFRLSNGAEVETYYYRVTSPGCRNFAEYSYEPVFFYRQHVIGKGHAYYGQQIKPYLTQGKPIQKADYHGEYY